MSLRSPGQFVIFTYSEVDCIEHLFINVSLRSPGHFITYNELDHLCPCDLQDIFQMAIKK